jgi:hypothetical protein
VQVAGSRYYNPGLGRWTRRDTIGERGGANLFDFVANSPSGHIDFLGLWLWTGADWAWLYMMGMGRPVNLAEIGLLGTWRAATASDVDALRGELAAKLAEGAVCSAEGFFHQNFSRSGSQTFIGARVAAGLNLLNPLFAIGDSTVFYEANLRVGYSCKCCNGELRRTSLIWYGRIDLHLRDYFQDPMPLGGYDDPVDVPLANCLADCWRDHPHDLGARLACIGQCRLAHGWPVTNLGNPYQINADTVETMAGVKTNPCP